MGYNVDMSKELFLNHHRFLFITGAIVVALFVGAMIFAVAFFGAPQRGAAPEQFTVALNRDNSGEVAEQLFDQGFIKSRTAFRIAFFGLRGIDLACIGCIEPGTYEISKSMNVWQIVNVFKRGPDMKWVVIPEGLRKEQIAEILARTLGWDERGKSDWVTEDTATEPDYVEGVYFPDTYLIPAGETGPEIAQRFINRFNEKLAPYAARLNQENVKWTTALKIASIVQREGTGKEDMPIIAGIIWNRLLDGMKLDMDATLQYVRDSALAFDNGFYRGIKIWWLPIAVADKQIDSAYNTYLYQGLPPHPIANPGTEAIEAAVNPAETGCLFYLHDSGGTIHCSKTYGEHLDNIEKYLK